MTASTRAIILIALTVQALRLSAAAYILMDASEALWTREVMALNGHRTHCWARKLGREVSE